MVQVAGVVLGVAVPAVAVGTAVLVDVGVLVGGVPVTVGVGVDVRHGSEYRSVKV
jgi:hypothetical protein